MDSAKIEEKAVYKLIDAISDDPKLSPRINTGDKYPSYDGDILIYEDENFTKKNLKGVIRVQVKGHDVSKTNFSEKTCKYLCEISSLEIYYQNGGTLFFVVEISNSGNEYKVKFFYLKLLPFIAKKYLDKYKKSKGKKSISSNAKTTIILREASKENFYLICTSFLDDMKKQYDYPNVVDNQVDLNNFERIINIDATMSNISHPMQLMNQSVIEYAYKDGLYIPLVECIISEVEGISPAIVSINDKIFYTKKKISHKQGNECVVLKLGNEITFYFDLVKKSMRYEYDLFGNVESQICDVEFLITLSKYSKLEIDGVEYELFLNKDFIDELLKLEPYLDELRLVKQFLNKTAINPNAIKTDVCSINEDGKTFIKSVLNKKPMSFSDREVKANLQIIKVFKLKLLFIFYPDKSNKWLIYDINDEFFLHHPFEMRNKTNARQKSYNVNHYLCVLGHMTQFDPKALLCDNVNILKVSNSVINTPVEFINELSLEMITPFVLQILNAYDSQKDEDFIHAAINIISWAMQYDSSLTHEINRLQAYTRIRLLTDEEKNMLHQNLTNNDIDDHFRLAIHIILGNKYEAEFYYKKLSDHDNKEFKTYPIFQLYKNLLGEAN